MEEVINGQIDVKTNANNNNNKKKKWLSKLKDHVTTNDGRVFYPCRFCNKVFGIKKTRTSHLKRCPAKEYILSVDDDADTQERHEPAVEASKQVDIPVDKKTSVKIDIQQNIVLNEQLNVEEIVSQSKSPPIKLTIRRNPVNGSNRQNLFTVTNSVILKEKNESNDEFDAIAKRLENNSVRITKTEAEHEVKTESETTCRECTKEFETAIDLLRHSRKCHSYPKVLMALSEVKKFYSVKDRSECPICRKPLKTNFRSAFVKHLHTHTNEMKYSCNVCNKKFRRSDHMKAHEKRHIVNEKK